LLITNDLAATPGKDLFARYAERMIIENELDADISGFHLNAVSSGLPLNVDLDTTLTVAAGNCYRLLARTLPRYELATPDRIWRHFLDNTGTVTVAEDHVRRQNLRGIIFPRIEANARSGCGRILRRSAGDWSRDAPLDDEAMWLVSDLLRLWLNTDDEFFVRLMELQLRRGT
jgi:hypothetical protein